MLVLLWASPGLELTHAQDTGRETEIEREVIGRSVEDRPIAAYRIGDAERVVALIGGIHTGAEEESVHIVEELRDYFAEHPDQLPRGLGLVFVPNANPDGYEHGTRVNARGVDLNRNWPTEDWQAEAYHGDRRVDAGDEPLSEAETRALYEFLVDLQPHFVLSYHGYAALLEDNDAGAAEPLTRAYAEAAGYRHIREWPYYPITGEFINAMAEEGIAAADVELEQHDQEAFQRNLQGLLRVLELVAGGE